MSKYDEFHSGSKILKKVSMKNTATGFLSSMMNNVCVGFTSYGYTPLKIGSKLDFQTGRAYDFYLDGYCNPGGTCTDIYTMQDQSYLCLVQNQDGIKAKYFFNGIHISDDHLKETTLKKGELILTNLEIGLYLNKVHRLEKAHHEEEEFRMNIRDL